jgi:hypothetical protein
MLARSGIRRLVTSSAPQTLLETISASRTSLKMATNFAKRGSALRLTIPTIATRSISTTYCLRKEHVDINKRIEEMVKKNDVVVFMKGVPDSPRCGFSNAVCQIMRMHEVPFEGHDVLSDEELRQGTAYFPY